MNYFILFNLPQKFQIDHQLLTKNFYKLQKKFHPDLFTLSSIKEQQNASKKSMLINHAFYTLNDTYRRAEYLLNLNHININNKPFTLNENSFLKKYLELQEEFHLIQKTTQKKEQLILFNERKIIKNIEKYNKVIEHELINEQWMNASNTLQKIYFFLKLKKQIKKIIKKNNNF